MKIITLIRILQRLDMNDTITVEELATIINQGVEQ